MKDVAACLQSGTVPSHCSDMYMQGHRLEALQVVFTGLECSALCNPAVAVLYFVLHMGKDRDYMAWCFFNF